MRNLAWVGAALLASGCAQGATNSQLGQITALTNQVTELTMWANGYVVSGNDTTVVKPEDAVAPSVNASIRQSRAYEPRFSALCQYLQELVDTSVLPQLQELTDACPTVGPGDGDPPGNKPPEFP